MTVSKSLRFQILRRDNHACRYCGTAASPERALTVDHVVPGALGGSDAPDNLMAACRDCNAGKAATPADASLVADVSQDAIRWAAAMRQAADDAHAERRDRQVWHEWFEDTWGEWSTGGAMKRPIPKDAAWEDTIVRFFELGLNAHDLREAVRKTMGKTHVPPADKFRYFCGICWGMLTERQNAAHAILEPKPEPVPARAAVHPEDAYAASVFLHLTAVCDSAVLRNFYGRD